MDVHEMIEFLPNMICWKNLPCLLTISQVFSLIEVKTIQPIQIYKLFYFQPIFSGGPPKLEGQESVRWARREKETRSKDIFHLRRDFHLGRNFYIHRDFNLSKDSYPCSRDTSPCRGSQLCRDFHLCKNSHSPSRDSP